jgi:hypothetical protein
MPPYCLPEDVKNLINTDLDDNKIVEIIKDVDQELDEDLNGYYMSDVTKKGCSKRLAAVTIAQNQRSVFKNTGDLKIVNNGNVREWQTWVDIKINEAKIGEHRKGKVFSTKRWLC